MSKYAQLASALEDIETISGKLNAFDKNASKRADALGAVLDNTNDILEEVQAGVKKLVAIEMEDDSAEEERKDKEKEARHRAMFDGLRKAVDAIPSMIERPVDVSYDISNMAARILALEGAMADMRGMVKSLLTARRVPQFDKNGNIIAVKLEE